MTLDARDWMPQALCRGKGDLFFPEKPGIHGAKQAKEAAAICRSCPVIVECGKYRVETDSGWGVWAGTVYRTSNAGVSEGGPKPMRRSA